MKTLVIGASVNPERYTYKAVERLLSHKHEVVAIGSKNGSILGINIETGPIPFKNIHTITLYINAQVQKGYYNYIIDLQPKRIIFNPGTENQEFMLILDKNNIKYEIACTLVMLATGQF